MPENRRTSLSLGCTKGRRQSFQAIKKARPKSGSFLERVKGIEPS